MPLLCCLSLHSWRHETRMTPGPIARASLFYLRFCRRCGKSEIHVRPFMGEAQWVPLEPWPIGPIPSTSAWELERFATATVENCRKWAGAYFQNDPV